MIFDQIKSTTSIKNKLLLPAVVITGPSKGISYAHLQYSSLLLFLVSPRVGLRHLKFKIIIFHLILGLCRALGFAELP